MFHDMGAPIEPASPSQAALFNPAFVDQAFACREYAFDYSVLRRQLAGRLDALDVDLRLSTTVESIAETGSAAVARLSDGTEIAAGTIFNVTYSQINHLLGTAGLAPVGLKHELAEIALVEVPPELARYGITVIDGPFMSCMPYPAAGLHSLTHVRFTPHASWTDQGAGQSAHRHMESLDPVSHHRHMLLDSQRYIPALAGARWDRSLFEVKTVLTKNEKDDGRPILFHRQPADSRIVSVMGGKIDNIYDLFDLMRRARPEWGGCGPVVCLRPPAARPRAHDRARRPRRRPPAAVRHRHRNRTRDRPRTRLDAGSARGPAAVAGRDDRLRDRGLRQLRAARALDLCGGAGCRRCAARCS